MGELLLAMAVLAVGVAIVMGADAEGVLSSAPARIVALVAVVAAIVMFFPAEWITTPDGRSYDWSRTAQLRCDQVFGTSWTRNIPVYERSGMLGWGPRPTRDWPFDRKR